MYPPPNPGTGVAPATCLFQPVEPEIGLIRTQPAGGNVALSKDSLNVVRGPFKAGPYTYSLYSVFGVEFVLGAFLLSLSPAIKAKDITNTNNKTVTTFLLICCFSPLI